jgi:PadR family transcriptional regulator PadR
MHGDRWPSAFTPAVLSSHFPCQIHHSPNSAMSPRNERSGVVAGTLEMLILRTVSLRSLHGYAIAQHLAQVSDGVLLVEQGSLYPALERLLNKGYVTAKWAESPTGRQARFYTITSSGRRQLTEEFEEYHRLSYAIARVMGTT